MTAPAADRAAHGEAALAGLRVLDLSGPMGNYCGKLFAELGADVVLVEPPGGTALRHQPPFAGDRPDPERSLPYLYNNTSKRSLRLDLDHPEGQQVLRDLAAGADLLIETDSPGRMAARGLGHEELSADHPGLVTTSITPFGQTGPYAEYEAGDLVCLAMGGLLYLGGYVDGPPVQAGLQQAYVAGNLFGAVASMLAVTAAETTGQGQHVDVSVQESVVMGLENAAQFQDLEGRVRRRTGGRQWRAGAGVFPARTATSTCSPGASVATGSGPTWSPGWTASRLRAWTSCAASSGASGSSSRRRRTGTCSPPSSSRSPSAGPRPSSTATRRSGAFRCARCPSPRTSCRAHSCGIAATSCRSRARTAGPRSCPARRTRSPGRPGGRRAVPLGSVSTASGSCTSWAIPRAGGRAAEGGVI
ncbi:CoA transferase [Blastococcus brunescens]|uniref:CoA transferase n=1 Tax=Blastococcus brunescens TaxID=1564165 RepID=A0ABZ1B375_9ACTN|nr:CoA transferase [Blastococcus sp. BMG 8361]WRL64223.1 CoA transferase [Blastococcus sp. BMG 8361]